MQATLKTKSFIVSFYFLKVLVDANNDKLKERLIIGDNKFTYLMPNQLLIIIDRMLADVVGEKEAPEKIDLQ